jgi:hypothetical protein
VLNALKALFGPAPSNPVCAVTKVPCGCPANRRSYR